MKSRTVILNESLKLFYSKHPDFRVISAMEYDDLLIFETEYRNELEDSKYIIPLASVNTITGEVGTFNPLENDLEKYSIALSKKINL